ncbi:MAG: hypothetical protein AB8B83_03950 [Bdellovibrionales bacterium]
MLNSYAHTDYEPSNFGTITLSNNFEQAGALTGTRKTTFETIKDIAENAETTAGVEELVLNPYAQSLKQQVFSLILNGTPHGQVLDYIYDHLDGESTAIIERTLSEFAQEFSDMGLNDMARELQHVIAALPILSYSDLGMGVDFFNTGPNSTGSVENAGEVGRLRYAIEAHFDDERYKPKADVKPFLGASYG